MRYKLIVACLMVLAWQNPRALGQTLKLTTYNFNWNNTDVDASIDVIRKSEADIVCFQELNPGPFKQLRLALTTDYSHWYRANQFAFCSKKPLHGFEASIHVNYVIGTTEIGGKQIQIVNTHLSPLSIPEDTSLASLFVELGTQDEKHVNELRGLLRDLRSDLPSIIVGDFNSVDGSRAVTLLLDKGYVDCFSSVNAGDPIEPTWELNRMLDVEKASGQAETARRLPLALRLDYVFCSRELCAFSCNVISGGGSDHFPVVSEIGLRAAAESDETHSSIIHVDEQ